MPNITVENGKKGKNLRINVLKKIRRGHSSVVEKEKSFEDETPKT